MVFDDYTDYGGCRRAVDEFIEAGADVDIRRSRAELRGSSSRMTPADMRSRIPMRRRRRALAWGFAGFMIALSSGATEAQTVSRLEPLRFLLGEWQGIGDQAGATGGFTFRSTVQDRVIVRTNYSDTPATAGSAASRHDDLMVIYVDGDAVKADYFDNEGHVIRYLVQLRPGNVVFVSEVRAAEPRYRLTYVRAEDGTITGSFEVAPPGRPEAFAPYLSWRARKTR
jgi:hypothetical protein